MKVALISDLQRMIGCWLRRSLGHCLLSLWIGLSGSWGVERDWISGLW